MTTPSTDPKITKITNDLAKLEKIVRVLALKVQTLEQENKRLKNAVGRNTNSIFDTNSRVSKGLK